LVPQQLQQAVMAMSAQNKQAAGGQFSATAELLLIIQVRKQVGPDGRKLVEDDFNAVASQMPGLQERGKLSLKQKFNCLLTMQKPTGEGEQLYTVNDLVEANGVGAMVIILHTQIEQLSALTHTCPACAVACSTLAACSASACPIRLTAKWKEPTNTA
jgi:hypothetical protein